MKKKIFLAGLGVWLGLMLASRLAASNADGPAATGMIEGRVINTRNGEYLENARLTIQGTSLETFTDSGGQFRLGPVRAGTVKVRVFFTGLEPMTDTVVVASGATVSRDFSLGGSSRGPDAERDRDVVKLREFTVATSREMEASAIAINEQRFAPNLKTVVATDEFGTVAEGHVGEFMKFLPGVTMEYAGGNAREISINGVPAAYVPVTIDGFSLASAVGNGTGRAAAVDMISINGLARIEVSYSPTPDSQGAALAGSVNMVPRSSFERSRPIFNGSAYVMMRDNRREFQPTPIPRENRSRKVYPGLDFSWVVPVNKRFGFTLSGGHTVQYAGQDFTSNTWRGTVAPTDGAAFPSTTPDQPYLSAYQVRGGGKETTRDSLSGSLDYRVGPHDRVSLSLQISTFEENYSQQALTFNVTRVLPGNFSTTFTHGDTGTGAGNLQMTNSGTFRFNRTYMPTFIWRHDGPTWKSDVGVGLSRAQYTGADIDRGLFSGTTAQRTNVSISFDDMFYLRPGRITVTDGTTRAPIDAFRLSSYNLTSTSSGVVASNDRQRTAYANAQRAFGGLVLKTGLDVRESMRDLRPVSTTYAYVGAGGNVNAAPYVSPALSERALPFGFPQAEWVSQAKTWEAYRANPALFTTDENAIYRNGVSGSKHAAEVVSAGYLRGDLSLFESRLKLVGGLRAEQTNIKAEGPFTDATRNYQRDTAGKVITVASPTVADPGRRVPVVIFPTTNPLAVSRLTYLERGTQVDKEYLRLFPSLNGAFNLRENLIARAAHYTSIGRPDFNQYAGGLTLPDTESPASRANLITVNNAAIKPWSAESTNVRLEYYFQGVGQISLGAFRRDFKNFFGGTFFPATPEFLALYGLDPSIYGGYEVSTQYNLPGRVRTEGLDFSYKQALTFLPAWARGVQVFANASAQRATGVASDNFSGYIPRSGSWGVSLTRQKYNARINWNYRGRQRRGLITGTGIEPGTYNWGSKRLYIDISGEYSLTRRIGLFVNLRNINDATEDMKVAGPSTPAQAQFRQRLDFGSLWTLGVKGTF
jgi:iron complex outermembrane receptor protein